MTNGNRALSVTTSHHDRVELADLTAGGDNANKMLHNSTYVYDGF